MSPFVLMGLVWEQAWGRCCKGDTTVLGAKGLWLRLGGLRAPRLIRGVPMEGLLWGGVLPAMRGTATSGGCMSPGPADVLHGAHPSPELVQWALGLPSEGTHAWVDITLQCPGSPCVVGTHSGGLPAPPQAGTGGSLPSTAITGGGLPVGCPRWAQRSLSPGMLWGCPCPACPGWAQRGPAPGWGSQRGSALCPGCARRAQRCPPGAQRVLSGHGGFRPEITARVCPVPRAV